MAFSFFFMCNPHEKGAILFSFLDYNYLRRAGREFEEQVILVTNCSSIYGKRTENTFLSPLFQLRQLVTVGYERQQVVIKTKQFGKKKMISRLPCHHLEESAPLEDGNDVKRHWRLSIT